jgi:myo-inositol catabolism protein IolC
VTTSNPLFILAVDQRPWLTKALFGHTGSVTPAERAIATAAKHLVLEGLLEARTGNDTSAAILVDEQLGAGVPELATANRIRLAMPIERAGRAIYETEPEDLAAFLAHFEPEFAKVLVRYNIEEDAEQNEVQLQRLAEASRISRDSGATFLFELLVPPTDRQLQSVDGDVVRFESELRPLLTRQAMEAIGARMDVDLWKLEHQDSVESTDAAVRIAREQGGECILLGAGAASDTVKGWLGRAASGGFIGFAIGRSIWWDAVKLNIAEPDRRAEAQSMIASQYREFVQAFLTPQPERVGNVVG